ncbi:hypothetical protein F5Y16DRAFT_392082 [Xylariaceae sp. FL0255]|nr:hypothetical protein F5Y16DRAFT_392082 [Xylariaceae sp. FL0255]
MECAKPCSNDADLRKHGQQEGHRPYGCLCGSRFGRLDVLTRHIKSKINSNPEHPCPHCDRYQGSRAFQRYDHLVQHLRTFHKLDQEAIVKLKRHGSPEINRGSPQQTQDPASAPPVIALAPIGQQLRDGFEPNVPNVIGQQFPAEYHLAAFQEPASHLPCPIRDCPLVDHLGFQDQQALDEHMLNIHQLMAVNNPSIQVQPAASFTYVPDPIMPMMNQGFDMQQELLTGYSEQPVYTAAADPLPNNMYFTEGVFRSDMSLGGCYYQNDINNANIFDTSAFDNSGFHDSSDSAFDFGIN